MVKMFTQFSMPQLPYFQFIPTFSSFPALVGDTVPLLALPSVVLSGFSVLEVPAKVNKLKCKIIYKSSLKIKFLLCNFDPQQKRWNISYSFMQNEQEFFRVDITFFVSTKCIFMRVNCVNIKVGLRTALYMVRVTSLVLMFAQHLIQVIAASV